MTDLSNILPLALNRLDAFEDMLKAQLRLVKFPKTLDDNLESAPKVVKRVRHKGGRRFLFREKA